MNNGSTHQFLSFLESSNARGGLETDDVLAALLPLMKQVLTAHAAGLVAPLDGLQDLVLTEQGHLMFAPAKAVPPTQQAAKIEALQTPASRALEVVAESRRTADVDTATVSVANLQVGDAAQPLSKPVFLLHYRSWEHSLGHHDALTDIFSLGLLLASLACGLDFTDPEDLELFSVNRTNLFGVNRRLNPVVASVIVQTTELNRHKRAPDLAQVISRLEQYREQPLEFDCRRLHGFQESSLTGKRRLIQAHLRDRLFEISRRNRLLYFKPTLQTLNLTEASVPLVLEIRHIRLEQLFIWQAELAATVAAGTPISLGKYLRFEDAPYLPGVLDKIISEARHDRAEFGFAQLRLVLCFLHWHNLKEAPAECIHSPLLLLPVELTKKKGVRDQYLLEPVSNDAEVNPALRYHLKQLYNLDLPETVDLKETSLDQFYAFLQVQIQASEPGVALHKIDRPQIELIHERARQRVDQYRRRMKLKARANLPKDKPEYSYERENLRPLGLQLFLQRVRPTPLPLREAAGAAPTARRPYVLAPEPAIEPGKVLETERHTFALREGNNPNPYAWDFDLCNLTLGNFNYRKMTLVRDYAKLIETDLASAAFDTVFSLQPKPSEPGPLPTLPLNDQHLILPCDAAQAAAISRARAGGSYIIQGPPGTGKSQTITNLIADYVARGKRVLFVCEKRAAIDVVFHRLRQQGLDELCCLIHDSQTDKKEFIQNLKQTYEKLLAQTAEGDSATKARTAALRTMEQELAGIGRFAEAMRQPQPNTGIPLRRLLHRLVEIRDPARALPPQVEEVLPEYALWLAHGETVNRLRAALEDLGEDLCFAQHPLHCLGQGPLEAERPLEALSTHLDQAEEYLDAIENALELTGLPGELWDTFAEIQTILDFAVRVQPLAERQLLGLLEPGPLAQEFDALVAEFNQSAARLQQAQEKTAGWTHPLTPDDTQVALAQARSFEKSFLRLFQPAFWRLRKALQSHYDFQRHAVAPPWTKILGELAAQHEAQGQYDSLYQKVSQQWRAPDVPGFCQLTVELRTDPCAAHPSVKALIHQLAHAEEAASLIASLGGIRDKVGQLNETLRFLLASHEQLALPALSEVLAQLREQTGSLAELLPVLRDLAELPETFRHALRTATVPLSEFEAAIAHKSVNAVYRRDRAINRFEGRTLARKMERLEQQYREWLGLNARCLRAAVRQKFLEHVNVSSQPASQLDATQKAFKKTYSAGRRELEHEFGKTMRYKSIRDLAADNSGEVIQDLKPIWLMSPLSVSDALPLDPDRFDVVIFDEASQIPLEEAIPAIYRAQQVIVVGDEMQLPPTTFFAANRPEESSLVVEEAGERVEVDLDADSFLNQSASNLPSTLLAWHYRSRYEALISFSNAAFYSGNLFTIPDRQRLLAERPPLQITAAEQGGPNVEHLLARSLSFHFMANGLYADRQNPAEANYIAHLVRGLLQRQTGLSLGIVAFSEAQQSEIEDALRRLAEEDDLFSDQLEAEYAREAHDQFCGLFVKNLENVQGDERDIIIMSICYGPDAGGRILMNFGPINQRGGERRLNVIFSRAKHHMAVVTSIRHSDITNEYNDGANSLKNFLQYAEAVSQGNEASARRVLENLNPLSRQALTPASQNDAVVEAVAAALRARGYAVETNVGQSRFRCDLAVRSNSDSQYQLGILVDTDAHYASPNLLDRYLIQPSILRAFGWRLALVLTKDWYHTPDEVLSRLERLLQGQAPETEGLAEEPEVTASTPVAAEKGPATSGAAQPRSAASVAPTAVAKPKVKDGDDRPTHDPASGGAPHFEFAGGSSRKFWEISVTGNEFTVRFGRLGSVGQTQTKRFTDGAKAQQEAARLIAEKLKKGYRECGR